MNYSQTPPYTVLSTRDISFMVLQHVQRFARYWDMIANSGRFKHTLPLVLGNPEKGDSAFQRFMQLSDALYKEAGSTWKIALPRLYKMLYQSLINDFKIAEKTVRTALNNDFEQSNQRGSLDLLLNKQKVIKTGKANKRQQQHG